MIIDHGTEWGISKFKYISSGTDVILDLVAHVPIVYVHHCKTEPRQCTCVLRGQPMVVDN